MMDYLWGFFHFHFQVTAYSDVLCVPCQSDASDGKHQAIIWPNNQAGLLNTLVASHLDLGHVLLNHPVVS